MKNLFKSFLKSGLKPTSRRFTARRRHRSAAESLETRTLLTGNVQAVISGGNLVLTGDVDSNEVQVSFDSGLNNIVVDGLNGTTINGVSSQFTAFTGTQRLPGSILAALGDGDDVLTINGVIALDNVEANGEAGDDTITLNNTHSGDNVELNGGAGNDRLEINVSGIDDNLTIRGGDGNDTISIEVSVVDDFFTVEGGAGDDVVGLNQFSVGDDLRIDLGDGNDSLIANGVSSDDNLIVDSGAGDDTLRIAAGFTKDNMSLLTGPGDDNVIFRNNIVIDDLSIGTGDGNDSIDFRNSLAQDNLFVSTGDGNDTFIYNESDVDDFIHLSTGAGADSVVLMNSVFHHNLFVDTGLDNDLIVVQPSSVGDGADFFTGTGDDRVLFDGANTFGARLNVNTGAGNDAFEVDPTTNLGRSLFTFGAESNDVDNAAVDTVLNDPTTGLLTLAAQTESQLLATVAPTAVNDAFSTSSVRTVDAASGVLANDTAGSLGGTLSAAVLTSPSSGTLTLNSDGSFTYTADNGFQGTDTFTYTVTDVFGSTDSGTVTITVEDLNLTLDTSGNTAVISNGTLIVDNSTFVVQGTTAENASITVDSDGDGDFDDASTAADALGNFTVNVTLTNDATNRGANTLQVKAENGGQEATQSLAVHFAEGSVVRFNTSLGPYDVELLDTEAPQTVTAFLADLSRYDNSIVHRNVSNFVIQGGGFTAIADTVGTVMPFAAPPNEFSAANSNVRGTLSTAQIGSDINSFTGQWFANTVDNTQLDAVPHTVFGRVIGTGLTVVDQINAVPAFNLASETAQSALGQLPLQNYTPFSQDLTGTVSVAAGTNGVTGTGIAFTTEVGTGDGIQIGSQQFSVLSVIDDTSLTLSENHIAGASNVTAQINPAPTQSNFILSPISQLF